MLLPIFCLVFGFSVGAVVAPRVNSIVDFEGIQQRRAIREEFNCGKNDFTYFMEGVDDYYILTIRNTEYRIKFSKKLPTKVVYSKEVSTEIS